MAACQASRTDVIYRRLLLTKFFGCGWGDIRVHKRIMAFRQEMKANRMKLHQQIFTQSPVYIDGTTTKDAYCVIDGHFTSPLAYLFPGILPKESETARFQMLLPVQWKWERDKSRKPVCLHLAGTGDHHFWRRRNLMAKPLLKEASIGSIILENPFYGVRKPKDQMRSSLKYVVDLFVMGGALMLESSVLLNWCERRGLGPLGITGVSMGGNMASIAATAWHKPIAIVPCLSWTTASPVFTEGVLSHAISWDVLQKQLTDRFKQQLMECRVDSSPSTQSVDNFNSFVEQTEDLIISSEPKRNSQHNSQSLNSQVFIKHALQNNVLAGLGTISKQFDQVFSLVKGQNEGPVDADKETIQVMKTVMDNATHLINFSKPADPSSAIFVAATQDGYVPWRKELSPNEVWPGAEVRYLNAGHINAALRHTEVFRKAIKDAFDKVPLM